MNEEVSFDDVQVGMKVYDEHNKYLGTVIAKADNYYELMHYDKYISKKDSVIGGVNSEFNYFVAVKLAKPKKDKKSLVYSYGHGKYNVRCLKQSFLRKEEHYMGIPFNEIIKGMNAYKDGQRIGVVIAKSKNYEELAYYYGYNNPEKDQYKTTIFERIIAVRHTNNNDIGLYSYGQDSSGIYCEGDMDDSFIADSSQDFLILDYT